MTATTPLLRADLHIHSTASDGSLTPVAVVDAAASARLDIIAITDHDTVAGVAPALGAAHGRLRVIAGVELSSTHAGADLHILGYGIDADHLALKAYTDRARVRRAERIQGMVRLLAELGIAVDYDDVVAGAGPQARNLGRPHLAQALVRRGHVTTVSEAFDRYLHDGGPAALPIELITPREAIELIRAAGGVAVWAHPPAQLLASELPNFVEWGLEGLECYRPRTLPDERHAIAQLGARYDLLLTGGSDWHGPWHGPLGDFAISAAEIQRLLWRLDRITPPAESHP